MTSSNAPAAAPGFPHGPVGVAAARAEPHPEPDPDRARRERVVGGTAIALATSMILSNTVVSWAGAPGYSAPVAEVLAFHADHRVAVATAVGLEALAVPLLLGFLAGLRGLVERRGGAGADWARLALAAGAAASAAFGLYAVLWDGVVLAAGESALPSPVLELVWRMHAAAFAFALPALGTAFVGAALATDAGRLTPPWQRRLAVVGAGLLLAAGTANLAVADGSWLLFVGLPGYAAWLVWLLATGVRLVRRRPADRPAATPTSGERA